MGRTRARFSIDSRGVSLAFGKTTSSTPRRLYNRNPDTKRVHYVTMDHHVDCAGKNRQATFGEPMLTQSEYKTHFRFGQSALWWFTVSEAHWSKRFMIQSETILHINTSKRFGYRFFRYGPNQQEMKVHSSWRKVQGCWVGKFKNGWHPH